MSDAVEFQGAHQANGTIDPIQVPEPQPPLTIQALHDRLVRSFDDLRTLLSAIRAPYPTQTGNGTRLPRQPNISIHHDLEIVLRDIKELGYEKLDDLARVIRDAKIQKPVNDKQYLMEYMIQGAACLSNDLVSKDITNSFINTLWADLQHPPSMLLDDECMYRQPDGSKNNYSMPHVGAAGMPYAKTVPPLSLRAGAMPDPALIFEVLMKRKQPEEHPNRVSSMLFYLASIIIHDVFKTNRHNYNISDTSSYLDLAPLYGSNWDEQKAMRTFKNGRIKPDCFSETRLLSFPPGVGALLIMFNRYHNYVVEQLALINEDNRFTDTGAKVDRYGQKGLDKRDDDLFQTGRLITCGLYVNIILIDYVRTILNLNRTDDDWQLNPRVEIPEGPPRGGGNQVSCEFNLVYRWHAATSARDEKWTEQLYKEFFESGKDPIDPNVPKPEDFVRLMKRLGEIEKSIPVDPQKRHWPALKSEVLQRDDNGNFNDNDLAAFITSGIEDCANVMGPRNVPPVMKFIEIMGIMQARTWKVATLNEFRKHFALEPHETFESITKEPEVANALKHLYDTPDQVELYPGLVVEDAKRPMMPGSGLCPSYTVSRAVLSDAVALVRGDRYYTEAFTPATLTNWGYKECSSELAIDNGCVFYKLFLRALPHNYNPASVYVHYPLTVPHGENGMQEVLHLLGKAHKYNFDKPKHVVPPTVLFTYDACKAVFGNQKDFHVTSTPAMKFLMGDAAKTFMLAGDGPKNTASRTLMSDALYIGGHSRGVPTGHEPWYTAVRDFYEQITVSLLSQKSSTLAGVRCVDIIRDIGNLAHVHFAANMFSLPLKTASSTHGLFAEQELYLILVVVSIAVYFDVDPTRSFPLRQQAYEATQTLGKILEVQVGAVAAGGKVAEELINYIQPNASSLKHYGIHMIAKLVKEEPDVTKLVWGNLMGVLAGMVAPQAQLWGQLMDFYLSGDGAKYLPELHKLAQADTPDADDKLLQYVMEGIRLNGEQGATRLVENPITIPDDTGIPHIPKSHHFQPGDQVLLNIKAASRDPKAYRHPDELRLDRPLDSYLEWGSGVHQCLGMPMSRVALTTMFKTVMRLPGLRPAIVSVGGIPQPSRVKKVLKEFTPGDLKFVPAEWHYHAYLTEDWDVYFPFPTSLKVNFAEHMDDDA